MLDEGAAIGIRKTRLAAAVLEREGFTTAVVERRYYGGTVRAPNDPLLALVGVDNRETRARLDEAAFPWVVDAGLGAGPEGYLDMAIRRLPARKPASELWPPVATKRLTTGHPALPAAYEVLADRSGDACGVLQLSERTVATAFVGTVAGCLAIGGVLRELHGGQALELVDLSLRQPGEIEVASAATEPTARMATLPVGPQAA
jgi:hypothetical protein